jgi:outer membrane protein OmpA-like peptidoglycan-associated protein
MIRTQKLVSMRNLMLMVSFATAGVSVLGGCASTQPSTDLIAARNAYDRASRGPAAQLAPADLHVARQTLNEAESVYADEGDTPEARDMAYTAAQRAQIAEARARSIQAMQQRARAVGQLEAARSQQLQTTSAELEKTKDQLAAEQARRATAEQALAALGNVKEDPRGKVITLSGSVLFASGQAKLLPTANERLAEVARALVAQDEKSQIIVEGHTDSQGSDEFNRELSQRRAETVREFLIAHGVDGNRLRAEGAGEANPIAPNTTAEGRANNRRVEIIVQQPAQNMPGTTNPNAPSPGMNMPTPGSGSNPKAMPPK